VSIPQPHRAQVSFLSHRLHERSRLGVRGVLSLVVRSRSRRCIAIHYRFVRIASRVAASTRLLLLARSASFEGERGRPELSAKEGSWQRRQLLCCRSEGRAPTTAADRSLSRALGREAERFSVQVLARIQQTAGLSDWPFRWHCERRPTSGINDVGWPNASACLGRRGRMLSVEWGIHLNQLNGAPASASAARGRPRGTALAVGHEEAETRPEDHVRDARGRVLNLS